MKTVNHSDGSTDAPGFQSHHSDWSCFPPACPLSGICWFYLQRLGQRSSRTQAPASPWKPATAWSQKTPQSPLWGQSDLIQKKHKKTGKYLKHFIVKLVFSFFSFSFLCRISTAFQVIWTCLYGLLWNPESGGSCRVQDCQRSFGQQCRRIWRSGHYPHVPRYEQGSWYDAF